MMATCQLLSNVHETTGLLTGKGNDPMQQEKEVTSKDWIIRWAVSLSTPLYSLRMRNEVDEEMRTFARRMPEYHSVAMAGILHDIILTVDSTDPFRNLYRGERGAVRLPGGEAFGSWENYASDLMPASNFDKAQDIALSPATEMLSDQSIELFFSALHSWEEARAYLLELHAEAKKGTLQQSVHEIVEDTLRWALLRRHAYGLDGDGFFHTTAGLWAERTKDIMAGNSFDESRMVRLRSGASVVDGSYERLNQTITDW